MAAHQQLLEDVPGAGLLAVTSPDRLFGNWSSTVQARTRGANPSLAHIETLLAPLAAHATLVTVLDAHPATLSWLGSVARHRVYPLGVDHFGQCGSLPDLYRVHGIDTASILDACAAACLSR
jgi:pyruvate dehydrogenase E1 component